VCSYAIQWLHVCTVVTKLIASRWRGGEGGAMRKHHRESLSVFKETYAVAKAMNARPNRVNVFDTGITLPGRSEVSLAATTPRRLQLASYLVTAVLSTQLQRNWSHSCCSDYSTAL